MSRRIRVNILIFIKVEKILTAKRIVCLVVQVRHVTTVLEKPTGNVGAQFLKQRIKREEILHILNCLLWLHQ